MKRISLLVTFLAISCQLFSQDLKEIYQNEDSATFENFLKQNELIYFPNLKHPINNAVYTVTASAAKDFLDEQLMSKDFKGNKKKYYLLDPKVKVYLTKKLFDQNCDAGVLKKRKDKGVFFGNVVVLKSELIKPIILDPKIIDAINNTDDYSPELRVKRNKIIQNFFSQTKSPNIEDEKNTTLLLDYNYHVNNLILNEELNQAIVNVTYGNHQQKEVVYKSINGIWKKCGEVKITLKPHP